MISYATTILETEEGFSSRVYNDTEGYPTVGYGLKVGYKGQFLCEFRKMPEMPEAVAHMWLCHKVSDIRDSIGNLQRLKSIYDRFGSVRQSVIVSMVYQLGMQGFLGFKNTIQLLEDGNYEGAAIEMLDSKWATQAAFRAERHSYMMRTGVLHDYYN